MGTILAIHVVICVVLIVVVLLQQSRGAGLSSVFGGGGQSLFGGRGAAPFLIKTTTVCAVLFMLTTLSLALISATRRAPKTAIEREIERGVVPLEQAFPAPEVPSPAPPESGTAGD